MPSASKHNKGTSPVKDKSSTVTERPYAAVNAPQSTVKQAAVKGGSAKMNVHDLDRFMENQTDPRMLEHGRKDAKGTAAIMIFLSFVNSVHPLT